MNDSLSLVYFRSHDIRHLECLLYCVRKPVSNVNGIILSPRRHTLAGYNTSLASCIYYTTHAGYAEAILDPDILHN